MTTTRPPLLRPRQDRAIAGVCAGVGRHLGVSVGLVRLALVVLTLFSGAGIPVYIVLWALMKEDELALVDPASPAPAESAGAPSDGPRAGLLIGLGGVVLVIGAMSLATTFGLDLQVTFGGSLLVPALVVAVGALVVGTQLDQSRRDSWLTGSGPNRRFAWLRILLGVAVVAIGLFAIVTRGQSLAVIWDSALATAAVLAGLALLAAPFGVRLWRDLQEAQQDRAREALRADMAAHLHDSVLQTLALIQRQSGDSAAVTRLARTQERELRSWLYGDTSREPTSLAATIETAANEVEDLHGVPIELVSTGDAMVDDDGRALERAVREALSNAVRHGAPPVSAYVEIRPDHAEAFIRDHGAGFDPEQIPQDRHGVRQSLFARMERHGGQAEIRRRDPGTEVILRMPLTVTTPGEPA